MPEEKVDPFIPTAEPANDMFVPDAPEAVIEDDTRPQIIIEEANTHLAIREAMEPLSSKAKVFSRSRRLIQIIKPGAADPFDDIERDENATVFEAIALSHLEELLSETCIFLRYDGRAKKHKAVRCPSYISKSLLERKHWDHIRPLRGVSTIPILRQDGSLCMAPGYDEETKMFYAPNCDPEVPGSPDLDMARSAVIDIMDVVRDFPFEDECHRMVWLSAVLSRVAWPAFHGGVPLTVVDANAPGVGKGKLVDAAAVISTGMIAAKTPWSFEDEEMRKKITCWVRAADPIALIDNIPSGQVLKWASLDAALTAGVWTDRILGKSETIRLPVETMFFATGNGLSVSGDAGRRTLRIRLESPLANPHLRSESEFKWHPLLDAVARERPFLLGKAINVVRAYICAGSPPQHFSSLGSFDGWSSTIRSAIVWAGFEDPCDALISNEPGTDEDAEARATMLAEWHHLYDSSGKGLTATEILRQLDNQDRELEDLREAIKVLRPARGGVLPTAKSLGWLLRSMRGRVHHVDGRKLKIMRRTGHASTSKWLVVSDEIEAETDLGAPIIDTAQQEHHARLASVPFDSDVGEGEIMSDKNGGNGDYLDPPNPKLYLSIDSSMPYTHGGWEAPESLHHLQDEKPHWAEIEPEDGDEEAI